jgi:hypothetical protein
VAVADVAADVVVEIDIHGDTLDRARRVAIRERESPLRVAISF